MRNSAPGVVEEVGLNDYDRPPGVQRTSDAGHLTVAVAHPRMKAVLDVSVVVCGPTASSGGADPAKAVSERHQRPAVQHAAGDASLRRPGQPAAHLRGLGGVKDDPSVSANGIRPSNSFTFPGAGSPASLTLASRRVFPATLITTTSRAAADFAQASALRRLQRAALERSGW